MKKLWTMPKVVVGLLCVFFFSVNVYAGLVHVDDVNGYQISCPDGWRVVDQSTSATVIKAEFNKDSESGAQLRVEDNIHDSLQSFIRRYSSQFKNDMEGHWNGSMRVLGQREFRGEAKGYEIAYMFNRMDGVNYFFKHYLWKKGSRVYYIQAGTPAGKRAKIEPLLDELADSFSFR